MVRKGGELDHKRLAMKKSCKEAKGEALDESLEFERAH